MPDPRSYRPKPSEIPTRPGVYRFRDPAGRVIYVGKAVNLRARLANYFQPLPSLHPRTATMVTTAASVEWTVVNTEVEALQLEYSWIKEFDPRFNVKYRDDKSYPWLAVTVGEEFPRVMVGRGAKRKGTRYFGPYSHAWAIRETVDILLRVFPMRSCSNGVFKRSGQIGRPCLLGYIDKCSAPCVGSISAADHRAIVEDFCDFMAGHTTGFMRRIEKEMFAASEELDFERAARLRDDLAAMQRALEKQAVVLGDGADVDVIALAEDPLEVGVQIFYVRSGRIRGQRGWVADRVADGGTDELVEQFLLQLYAGESADAIPREILVPVLPPDRATLEELLSDVRGAKVQIRIPQRGDKKTLQETVAANAAQALALHKTKRASDLTTRNRALEEIQAALGLDEVPLRMECYDISNLQGTEVVASMVVFEDGLPRKSEYRRFVIRSVGGESGANDVASMHEVITRRFRRLLEEQATSIPAEDGPGGGPGTGPGTGRADELGPMLVDPETGRPRKFAYAPGLVVVDGGPPQVAAAKRALDELGIDDIPVVGLAKRLEEVWVPEEEDPVILPRSSEGLYLLQRLRDEAHRFAITHHRSRRSRSMVESVLDDVPGLGEVRRKTLLSHFGSLRKLRAATAEEIARVPGIGPATAAAIVRAVAADSASGRVSVNTATGEVTSADTETVPAASPDPATKES
ncbi:MAG: excinuclease ABC subunit UvrC [Nocardioides sp.]|uniref:excinuclease ABC subunit UvrC n=1 Tax=Nocardioides sp. TaxID=35761 RepID=UPI0039E440B7